MVAYPAAEAVPEDPEAVALAAAQAAAATYLAEARATRDTLAAQEATRRQSESGPAAAARLSASAARCWVRVRERHCHGLSPWPAIGADDQPLLSVHDRRQGACVNDKRVAGVQLWRHDRRETGGRLRRRLKLERRAAATLNAIRRTRSGPDLVALSADAVAGDKPEEVGILENEDVNLSAFDISARSEPDGGGSESVSGGSVPLPQFRVSPLILPAAIPAQFRRAPTLGRAASVGSDDEGSEAGHSPMASGVAEQILSWPEPSPANDGNTTVGLEHSSPLRSPDATMTILGPYGSLDSVGSGLIQTGLISLPVEIEGECRPADGSFNKNAVGTTCNLEITRGSSANIMMTAEAAHAKSADVQETAPASNAKSVSEQDNSSWKKSFATIPDLVANVVSKNDLDGIVSGIDQNQHAPSTPTAAAAAVVGSGAKVSSIERASGGSTDLVVVADLIRPSGARRGELRVGHGWISFTPSCSYDSSGSIPKRWVLTKLVELHGRRYVTIGRATYLLAVFSYDDSMIT